MSLSEDLIRTDEKYGAHNYHPLPVVLSRSEGPWVWDVDGRKYLDCLSAYSAVNQGHRHPRIVKALKDQLDRLDLTSRAFHNDVMGRFLKRLCEYTGFGSALPMNTGAEAVETGIKAARRWAYRKKDVSPGKAEIIVCANNFHGRTTTVVGFSTDPEANADYGPFTPGFKVIPFNDIPALEAAITENTAAFMIEPIQGEAGVIVPDGGYLNAARKVCSDHDVLFMLDEVQTGFCRTGKRFCWMHEGARPDIMQVGKALGGGLYPVSAMLADRRVMDMFTPGSHGSTFGGNPLASAVGLASIDVLEEERLDERSEELGKVFIEDLSALTGPRVKEVRGKGLFVGVELAERAGKARQYCMRLMDRGILAKDTHAQTIRFAPALVIRMEDLMDASRTIRDVLTT